MAVCQQTRLWKPVPGSHIVEKTQKRKAREKLAGREKGRDREPVSISFTTIFRRPSSPQFPPFFSCSIRAF